MALHFHGHAIVSADGKMADPAGIIPSVLRHAADRERFLAALDRAKLVVIGRIAHERYPNIGRRRLVVTRRVNTVAADPTDSLATLWNPEGTALDEILARLGIAAGTIAITGLFDLFLDHFTAFDLAEMNSVVLAGGTPCFSAGHPRSVLAGQGLVVAQFEVLDAQAGLTLTRWTKL
ncbi:MAG: dihydrofolate reductase [Devosia sp.]